MALRNSLYVRNKRICLTENDLQKPKSPSKHGKVLEGLLIIRIKIEGGVLLEGAFQQRNDQIPRSVHSLHRSAFHKRAF